MRAPLATLLTSALVCAILLPSACRSSAKEHLECLLPGAGMWIVHVGEPILGPLPDDPQFEPTRSVEVLALDSPSADSVRIADLNVDIGPSGNSALWADGVTGYRCSPAEKEKGGLYRCVIGWAFPARPSKWTREFELGCQAGVPTVNGLIMSPAELDLAKEIRSVFTDTYATTPRPGEVPQMK